VALRAVAGRAAPRPSRAAGGAGPGQGRMGQGRRSRRSANLDVTRRGQVAPAGQGAEGIRCGWIDAAVAAVMAHDRAAALAGVTRDSIYL
jgi:hypothetical protein